MKRGSRRAEDAGTGRSGTSRFSSDPQQQYLYVADGHEQKICILGATTLESSAASATAAVSPAVLQRRQHRDGLEGQRLHGRTLRGQAACRSSSSKGVAADDRARRERLRRRPRDIAGTSLLLAARRRARARTRALEPRSRAGDGHGAALRSRSAVAQAAAEPLGARQGDRRDVDAQDHVWIVHRDNLSARTKPRAEPEPADRRRAASTAPPVLEFDPAGNVVGHWGGPGRRL